MFKRLSLPRHLGVDFDAEFSHNNYGEQMAKSAALLRPNELWTPASKLHLITHKPQLDADESKPLIQQALSRGNLVEISGRRSSGRTSLCLHILAQATARGEVCAVVDMHDSFHPASAQGAAVDLGQIVWVRCQSNGQHAVRAADLLLHAGGFGVVLLDLCEASPNALSRIPLSYWYRLRRAIEHTSTVLLICADSSEAKWSFISTIGLKRQAEHWTGKKPFLRFQGLQTAATLSKTSTIPERLYISSVA